tara:strand:- start:26 stop:214 length:189 start_codon:yes stop_codon:yes gene_type:complete
MSIKPFQPEALKSRFTKPLELLTQRAVNTPNTAEKIIKVAQTSKRIYSAELCPILKESAPKV